MKVLFLILAVFVSVASAQTTQPCSDMSIEAADKVDPSAPLIFTIRSNKNASLAGMEFRWFLSAGDISSGQGSSSITVDVTGLGGQVITATVQVVGSRMSCETSKTIAINPPPLPECPFDTYGDIKFEDEKARLDNFAIQLTNQPTARGAIRAFAGNPTYKGEAAYRLERAKKYLVNVRGLAPEKILTTDSGYRTDLTVILYVVPDGANFPRLDPSTLPLSEIRFTKRPPSQTKRSTKPRRR